MLYDVVYAGGHNIIIYTANSELHYSHHPHHYSHHTRPHLPQLLQCQQHSCLSVTRPSETESETDVWIYCCSFLSRIMCLLPGIVQRQ